jgi:hypothetical protein
MKPVQYRNRRPVEYVPNDFRLALKSRRYYDREFIIRRKRRKLPGIFVGAAGIAFIVAGELIHGTLGLILFAFGSLLVAVGGHFELINRMGHQYKYFIVPVIALIILLVYWFRPETFGPLLPRQYVTQLSHLSSGFPFNSSRLTLVFGGAERTTFTFTKLQLEQAKKDPLSDSISQIPFKAYLDSGKLFFDADIFAGTDVPPIRMRHNVIRGLPYRWDGNYSGHALEIVTADTLPVFQLVYMSEDSIRIKGVFQVQGGLVIVDESGVLTARGKRVLFYGTRPIFKYPSWRFPHQRLSPF